MALTFVLSAIFIAVVSLLGLIFTAFSIYLVYIHWKFSHIPGPKRDSFFLGNVPLIRREREKGKIMGELMQELHNIYGPIVSMWGFHRPFLFVSDRELAKKCLITLNLPKNAKAYVNLGYPFGHRFAGRGLVTETDHGVWQKQRALLNPAFHRRYLMNLMSAFNNSCDLFLAKLDEMADGETVVNMAEEFARVTLDVIGKANENLKPHGHSPAFGVVRYSVACLTSGPCIIQIICMDCLQISEQKQSSKDIQLFRERLSEEMRLQQSRKVAFDIDVDVIRDPNSPFPSAVSKGLKGAQESIRTPFPQLLGLVFLSQSGLAEAIKFIREFAGNVIKERQEAVLRGDETPNDILARILKVAESESSLSFEDLIDQFLTFFVAGQETTSNQLSFTLFEILKHPDVENRIVQEIEIVLGSRQFVEHKDLGNLQYLGQTLKEGLRLHPPVGGTTRITTKEENLGGLTIPAGTSINVSWFILQRLSDAWSEPEKFDPDRFSPEKQIPPSVYYPFSVGPRTCIGQTFAQFEARVLMARLLQEFELTLLPGQNKMIHEERLTLRPKGGVLCTIKRRGLKQE